MSRDRKQVREWQSQEHGFGEGRTQVGEQLQTSPSWGATPALHRNKKGDALFRNSLQTLDLDHCFSHRYRHRTIQSFLQMKPWSEAKYNRIGVELAHRRVGVGVAWEVSLPTRTPTSLTCKVNHRAPPLPLQGS